MDSTPACLVLTDMRTLHGIATSCFLVLIGSAACGRDSTPPSPSPSPSPPPASQNPCTTTALEPDALTEEARERANPDKRRVLNDDGGRWNVLDSLWKHRAAIERGAIAEIPPFATAQDVGEIGVVQDQGDLVLPPNPFDLKNTGLRFTRNVVGGYDVTKIDALFRTTLGNRLTLGDDDTFETTVPFTYAFYGKTQSRTFVNSDGNVTFEEGDRSSAERDVSRLLTGPPRVAPFLADLDPSAGGRVFLQAASDQFTVTWCDVPGFDSTDKATIQMTLLPDGSVEMKFADTTTLRGAIVGLSPGRTGTFMPLDLSAAATLAGGPGAVGERFAQSLELDLVALARKFYRTHPDIYDQLVIWTDAKLARGSFAFEITVANEIQGIGIDIYDTSRDFGSGGRLRSVVMMDLLSKYPDDPAEKFLGENNTLSVIGQEVGHRWLSFLRFRDHTGRTSDALLGRDLAHWTFFFDSDASVMEGNDIEDRSGGSFLTTAAVERYSMLDQYAMGLVGEADVPPFFYVDSPTNVMPPATRESDPQIGVTFAGTRRTVLIQDVVAVLGPRQPSAVDAPRLHRQAFIFMVSAGRTADPSQIGKVDRIRQEWSAFFTRATAGRGRVETRLLPSS